MTDFGYRLLTKELSYSDDDINMHHSDSVLLF